MTSFSPSGVWQRRWQAAVFDDLSGARQARLTFATSRKRPAFVAIDVQDCYLRYGPMVLRRCRQILRDEELAVDAMQDVFVRLLRNEERLENRGLSSLLYRIATNVCLNRIRTQTRHPEDPQGELVYQIAQVQSDVDRQSEVRSLLARIFSREPESSGAIAVLHWVDGLTLQEVAREVGMSVSGVRKRLARIKEALDRMPSERSTASQEAEVHP